MAKSKGGDGSKLAAAAASQVADLRARLKRSEAANRKLRNGAGLLLEHITDVITSHPVEIHVPDRPEEQGTDLDELWPVVHFTDLQLGAVRPGNGDGENGYDTVIAQDRCRTMGERIRRIIDIQKQGGHAIRRGTLCVGGDMVEGETIFPGQRWEIDSPVFDQACVVGPRILVEMILCMLEVVDVLDVVCVPGNHGRPGHFKAGNHPRSNFDMVLYHTAKVLVESNPELASRVNFRMAEEFFIVTRVFRWGVMMIHGDVIRSQLGTPIYGLRRNAKSWADLLETPDIAEPWDVMLTGHYHSCFQFDSGSKTIIQTGSPESNNRFALAYLAEGSYASQRLFFMHERRRIVSDHIIALESLVPAADRHKAWEGKF